METMYKAPSNPELKKVEISAAVIRGEEKPNMITGEETKKLTRKKKKDESA